MEHFWVGFEKRGKEELGEHEKHYARRLFLTNPVSAAIEAKKGKKLESGGKALGHLLKNEAVGGIGGLAVGAGLGALSALHPKTRFHFLDKKPWSAKHMAALGGHFGASLGTTAGAIKGSFGHQASKIHGEHSKNK